MVQCTLNFQIRITNTVSIYRDYCCCKPVDRDDSKSNPQLFKFLFPLYKQTF